MTQPVPPLPSGGEGGAELTAARHKAVEAMMVAESAERTARHHRKAATSLLKTYERLLMEANGQLTLDSD